MYLIALFKDEWGFLLVMIMELQDASLEKYEHSCKAGRTHETPEMQSPCISNCVLYRRNKRMGDIPSEFSVTFPAQEYLD
ncbi:hypothetical protein [Pasteurella multocida]|nr:hypothetical protein [Pasteurella multocida]QDA12326.1 hypothetical protein E0L18_05380 [Pasteurella multocida subsp. multocida]